MKNTYITIALVAVALLSARGLIWFVGVGSGDGLAGSEANTATPDASAVVATIGGGETKITRGELDTQVQGLAQNPQVQVPPEGEERAAFERLVLDQMIGGVLLYKEAKTQGFTADVAAIDAEVAAITSNYESAAAFEAALTTAKVSKEDLRENIARQLITKQYYDKVAAEHRINATTEEIRAFYDTQIVPQNAEVVFENVEKDIKTHLEDQKTQEVLAGIVDELRKTADVQVLI